MAFMEINFTNGSHQHTLMTTGLDPPHWWDQVDGRSSSFLFFNPQGILYGVENGKFNKRSLSAYASDNWLGSATLIGTGGWDGFQFLFFMADGDFYGVHSDKFYKRSVPTHGDDNWLGSSEMIGTGGWSVFKYLMSPLGPPGHKK